MAFTTPRDWTDEELLDATIMNAHIRDNLRYLKGLDGVPTIESGLIIDNTDGDEYLLLPSLTTTERNALSAVNGMAIYNETTSALNAYQGGSWGLIGVTDHGALTGLTDDDHAQYQKETDFTSGSVLFRGSSVITEDNSNFFWNNTNKRLGLGTATPSTLLHIAGSGTSIIRLSDTGASTDTQVNAYMQYYRGLATSRVGWAGFGSSSNDDYTITNQISGGNINLMPTATGKVGIGVADPDTKLEILNAGDQLKLSFDGTDNAVFAVDTNGVLAITPSGAAVDFASKNLTGLGTLSAFTLNGTVTGGNNDLDNIGHIGLGNNAAIAQDGILYSETITLTTDGNQTGVDVYLAAYKTSATYTGVLSALFFSVGITASNTQNWTNPIGLCGVYGEVQTTTGTASSSTITGAASFRADASLAGDAANDMVLTNYYGLYVTTQTLVGNSKLTNDYGIYIENQAGGATLNYAIYTNDGLVRFGDTTDLCAGVAVFYSWGAVFADDYHLFMQSDYSSYVAGLDSGYLDLGANTGIRMRVGASGVVMTMLAQTLSIFPATFFSQVVEMGSYLRLKITDVDSADEADVWYDASENAIKVCLGGASVDTLATTADISTHAALTATHGVSGAIVGTTDSQALTNKSYNGLTLTSTTGTFTLASGKTFTVSNTLTLTATDTATLAIGGGGTLGSAAYTASTDYVAKATFEAHSVLIAISDNTPVVLELAASRMIGRASSGNIVALAKADILTIINVTEAADVTGSNTCDTPGGASTDTTAIHDDTANEITAITLKGTPAAGDEVVLEDSAASYVKKSATIGTLGSGIKLDDLATPDDNTDLDASTSKHGLAVKATAPAANILNVMGLVNGETAYTNKPIHDATNPEALGTVGPGTSLLASHRDHVHTLPAIDATGAATDIATRNSSTSAHGLLKKLDNTATNYMDGTGNWSVPGGGAVLSTDWKGDFNWDTSEYTTNEQDISALFSPTLALDVRRKYSVKLDLTTVEADGSFDELYIAVKEKVDGSNYRCIDRKTVTKAQLAATSEPAIIIDIPATSENIQITMQMKTALAGDATIYYAVVREHLE